MASVMETFNASATHHPNTIHATIDSLQTGFVSKAFDNFTPVSWFGVFLTIFLAAIVYDQLSYWQHKGPLAGDAWKIPFVGPFLESVNPKFSAYHTKWLSGPLSCVSVFHKFVVIAATRDMARKVLNSPMYVKPCVVDVAHKLLRPENWVFLDGKEHVEYRKGLNGLFTRQALENYLPGQEEVYNEYFEDFLRESEAAGEPKPWVYQLREIMCAVSCRTFVGHYMSREQVKRIADDYYLITAALELVNFPIILPFTKTWYGKKCADKVLEAFSNCAAKSKVRMRQKGAQPECIMDRWVMQMIASERYRERIAKGEKVPDEEKPPMLLRNFTDLEISMTVFTFLFASQDATSSACSWMLQVVADRPDVMQKVREEGDRLHPNPNEPISLEILESMQYTRAVVKETLRYRPPVLMVPYLVKKDFPIPEANYVAKKGSMIVPSTWLSLHDPDVYEQPDEFVPERWTIGDAEEKGNKNWLVFGTGPHYCLGQTYATLNLMLMLHKFSASYDWKHTKTPTSEEIKVFATIFPMDDLLLTIRRREGVATA
ncbi:uncharacterized protein MYCFIDRAFT_49450 [Pseudocercospora fijiensis CIRAD86]|uniref:Uncharacterized protein n=1 Tax=Pseudocercospora fijiensis (strain CIRAD86) TaxID=383855 RepID=M3BCE8_PSEFD|nr:uncharacterized protein MYCFIDRAFT_49450 [Pseudocercospora fijiensis CIRAD86]EME86833.1 hypothetical protein MYCFIDRAFT_49450 [Pseudocercospora fijiensis CIRAD86]